MKRLSQAQQQAARKHARHKQWKDEADERLAKAVVELANDKSVVRGKMGRGIRKWAEKTLRSRPANGNATEGEK